MQCLYLELLLIISHIHTCLLLDRPPLSFLSSYRNKFRFWSREDNRDYFDF
ncbi:hypothetical protein Hdeb2414_s0005g00167941 [Helianthus debilis subsp. tardiflorus]